MCERSSLFRSEAKSIISDLLKRTLELFDLSLHLVERNSHQFSLQKLCKLNYNIISDLDKYLLHHVV
jgi:hypothetical protein